MYFHMPLALPGENLYGLMSRFAKLNGLVNHVQACKSFLGNNNISVADASIHGTEESLFFQHYADDSQNSPFTFRQLRQRLGEGVNDKASENSSLRTSTLQNESFGDVARWRYCPDCYQSDRDKYGVAYWHLEHQLPTTLICLEHRTSLVEIPLKKKLLHDHLWLIDEVISGSEVFKNVLDHHWRPIAEIGCAALQDDSIPVETDVICGVIKEALTRKRVLGANGKLKIASFENEFYAFFGDKFWRTVSERLNLKKPRYLATELLHGFKGRTLNRVILIYWLFGTWQHFKKCCEWYAVFNTHSAGVREIQKPPYQYPVEVQQKNRNLCFSYMMSTDRPSRLEFCRVFYSSFRWLLNNDRLWFDQMLPITHSGKQQSLGF